MKFTKIYWLFYWSTFNRKCKFEERIINIKSTFHICYISDYIMKVPSITITEYNMFKKKLGNIKSIHIYFKFQLH